MKHTKVGKSELRKEGHSKLTGQAKYLDDLQPEGCWYGVTVRSEVPRGRIRAVHFEGDLPWDDIVVVSAKDIPGENHVACLDTDQPFLADKEVAHVQQAILLLAHPDKHLLEEARRNVRVEIDPLPGVFTIEDSRACREVIWGEDNVFKRFLIEKGDVDSVWDTATHIVEGDYETGAQEQLYIEPNGMMAVADPEEGVTLWGSLQCPYYVHKALMPLLDLPAEKVRIIQAETGGGFGGKEDYPSIIAGHAALLALKSGKTVKLIYDRAEDMAATTKRHPSWTRHKSAVAQDGTILAMDIEFALDGGAFMTLSPVVLSRGTIHAVGAYRCPNVRITSAAYATNTPPHGAFRGFGAPQSIFALERHIDAIARQLGMSREEVRRRNFLAEGDIMSTKQVVCDQVDMNLMLDRAFKESDYHQKVAEFATQDPNARFKKGIGFASFLHGAGFTGSGEVHLASVAGVEGTEDGNVRVLAASTEIGQGTRTIFSQIAAETLGVECDDIEISQPDTRAVPDSGPTVASRTVMVVGKLVQSACIGLKQTLLQSGLLKEGYSRDEFKAAVSAYRREHGALKSLSQYKQPPNITWNDDTYEGDAYASYAWAVYVAEVTVDTVTYETQVDDFVALQEVGKVINPTLAEGQIEGGVAQAIGYGIYEKVVWDKGNMLNNRMTNYIMPTAADLPPIRVFFEESDNPYGPWGAKGIGELPMDGAAPAILSAVEHATGLPVNSIPMLPEDLMEAFDARKEADHG